MPQTDKAALDAARECSKLHYEFCDDISGPCKNCRAIAALLTRYAREAVEAARPGIVRAAVGKATGYKEANDG